MPRNCQTVNSLPWEHHCAAELIAYPFPWKTGFLLLIIWYNPCFIRILCNDLPLLTSYLFLFFFSIWGLCLQTFVVFLQRLEESMRSSSDGGISRKDEKTGRKHIMTTCYKKCIAIQTLRTASNCYGLWTGTLHVLSQVDHLGFQMASGLKKFTSRLLNKRTLGDSSTNIWVQSPGLTIGKRPPLNQQNSEQKKSMLGCVV